MYFLYTEILISTGYMSYVRTYTSKQLKQHLKSCVNVQSTYSNAKHVVTITNQHCTLSRVYRPVYNR